MASTKANLFNSFYFWWQGIPTLWTFNWKRGLTKCCFVLCWFAVSTNCSPRSALYLKIIWLNSCGARPFTHLKINFINERFIKVSKRILSFGKAKNPDSCNIVSSLIWITWLSVYAVVNCDDNPDDITITSSGLFSQIWQNSSRATEGTESVDRLSTNHDE